MTPQEEIAMIDAELARQSAVSMSPQEEIAMIDAELARQQQSASSVPALQRPGPQHAQFVQPQGQQINPARDTAAGMGELAATVGTAAALKPVAGLAGLVQTLNPFAGEGSGAQVVKAIEGFGYRPGERGQAVAASAGETVKEYTPEIVKSGFRAVQQSPDAVAEQFGPLAGSLAKALPDAIGGLAGLGMRGVPVSALTKSGYQLPGKRRIARRMQQGVADAETAGYRLVEPQGPATRIVEPPERLTLGGGQIGPDGRPTGRPGARVERQPLLSMDRGGPRVEADPVARAVLAQDFDPSVVAAVRGTNAATREKLREMVDITDLSRTNKFTASEGMRNSNVLGESVLNRFRIVHAANRDAARQLDEVAGALKTERVDVSPAVDEFLKDLAQAEVRPAPGRPFFEGSDFEGVTGAENVLRNVIKRMRETKTPSAYDVHRLKRYIDEQVTFGKNAEGLAGKAEVMLKRLRHNLDGLLDDAFDNYNKVNTQYSETRQVIDALQDVAGRKMDLSGRNADSAVGTLMRRVLSNAQSRVPIMDAVYYLDNVAQQYAKGSSKAIALAGDKPRWGSGALPDITDDINIQTSFVAELERRFGPNASPNSFQGQIIEGAETASRNTQPTAVGIAVQGAKAGYKAVRGVNDERAMAAMRALLRDR